MLVAFLRWWLSELGGLLPSGAPHGPVPRRRLLLQPAAGGYHLLIEERGSARPLADAAVAVTALPAALQALPARQRRHPVTLGVTAAECLVRTVEMPAVGAEDMARMLALDLERTTPLKAGDVLSAHRVVGRGARGLAEVRHGMVKTRLVAPVERALDDAGMRLASIECRDGTEGERLVFRAGNAPPPRRSRLLAAASGLAVLVLLTAGAVHWWRQEEAMAAVAAEIVRVEPAAREARRALEAARAGAADAALLRRLEERRRPAAMVLEEVTRLLPDTAWLEELRLDGAGIEIAGRAEAAAALLPAFERSALFHEARFMTPLRIEAGRGGERFRLRARWRSPIFPETAATGGGR